MEEEDPGLPVNAKVRDSVLSTKAFLCKHFFPPLCWSRYFCCVKVLPQTSQVKEAGLSDESPGISVQEALCLVKPEALKYKNSRSMLLIRSYMYLVQGFPQWHLRREEDPDISAALLSRLVSNMDCAANTVAWGCPELGASILEYSSWQVVFMVLELSTWVEFLGLLLTNNTKHIYGYFKTRWSLEIYLKYHCNLHSPHHQGSCQLSQGFHCLLLVSLHQPTDTS